MKMKIKNRELLRKHGLKTTKQRLCISEILFSGKDMHFSAENLKEILFKKRISNEV